MSQEISMNASGLLTRRQLLMAGSLGAAAYFVPGLFAEELQVTPASTEGPFYPDRLPLDTDNDLVIIGNSTTPAVGEITHLTGRVLTRNGSPVNNAVVEIWQVDGNGAYLHSGTSNAERRDRNFQGFGRFTTNTAGEYRFRTVKPVDYPGRCPHIHFKVKRGDRTLLTSQIFISGHASNARDGIYRGVGGIVDRELVTATWRRIPESRIVEWRANFDIVLGVTPEERNDSRK
jgi:protocatechuate 3,4-dioxygenase beta subunit